MIYYLNIENWEPMNILSACSSLVPAIAQVLQNASNLIYKSLGLLGTLQELLLEGLLVDLAEQ